MDALGKTSMNFVLYCSIKLTDILDRCYVVCMAIRKSREELRVL